MSLRQKISTFIFAFPFFCVNSFATPASVFDLNAFLNTIDQHGATTIDKALALLPSELRENFTLIYKGHGLRETSYKYPAAILFGEDGKFVVNFGGAYHKVNGVDQPLSMGKEIEILQYVDKAAKFELYRLSFPLKRDRAGNIIPPEKNPAECRACHRDDPKLIWSPYNFWPGVYGSQDDFINKDEKKPFFDLMARLKTMSRYRSLIVKETNPFSPYQKTRYNFEGGVALPTSDENLGDRPNARFTFLVNRLDSNRVARKMKETYGVVKSIKMICDDTSFAKISPLDLTPDSPFLNEKNTFAEEDAFLYNEGSEAQVKTLAIENLLYEYFQKTKNPSLEKEFLNRTGTLENLYSKTFSHEDTMIFKIIDRDGNYLKDLRGFCALFKKQKYLPHF